MIYAILNFTPFIYFTKAHIAYKNFHIRSAPTTHHLTQKRTSFTALHIESIQMQAHILLSSQAYTSAHRLKTTIYCWHFALSLQP